MAQEWEIEGKNILITGGASGLGAAYAKNFLKFGAENVAILDIAEEIGKEFVRTLNETYENKVIFVKCDISKEEEIINGFQQALNSIKKIDVLINNAGIMNDSPDEWRNACTVNWQGQVSFARKAIAHMRKDEGGSGGTIINVSSTAAIMPTDYLPLHCGSKAAVLHFGRCISSPEFNEKTGIRVLTICIGATDTAILTNFESRLIEQRITKQLLSRMPIRGQRIDSAVEAMLTMFREGAPGSVWVSTADRPGQNITSALDVAYASLQKLLLPMTTNEQ